MHELHELKEKLMEELKEYASHEEMTASSLEIVDKLTHTIKNLCKIIEDMEYSERGESYGEESMRRGSYANEPSMRGGSYRGSYGEGSYGDSSYARGRGRNARRDSMGRYASAHDMMNERLQELYDDAPDGRTKQEIQKLMMKLGQM